MLLTDKKNIKKILVLKLRHIGDVLLAVPVFRALREYFPEAHITALVNAGTEEVLKGNRLIDDIITFDRGIKKLKPLKKYTMEFSFLKLIRAKGFDMTVDLTGGDRAALISFISGAKYRLAYDSGSDGFLGKKYLYTHLAKKNEHQHIVLQNLNIIQQLDIKTDNLTVDISIPENARQFIKNIFEENNIPPHPTLANGGQMLVKVVNVHPASRWFFKCWKDEYMAGVISWLIERGIKVIVTSSSDKKEMEKTKRILSLVDGDSPDSTNSSLVTRHSSLVVDLCGKTTIKQLAAISAASDLFFGVDSAPMHIAAAVGTPVIALFGPSGAFHWGPWDNSYRYQASGVRRQEKPYPKKNGMQTFGRHTVIQRNWECVPCGEDGCGGSKTSKCLEDITPDEIKTILLEKIAHGKTIK